MLLFISLPVSALEIGAGHDLIRGGDVYQISHDVGDYIVTW